MTLLLSSPPPSSSPPSHLQYIFRSLNIMNSIYLTPRESSYVCNLFPLHDSGTMVRFRLSATLPKRREQKTSARGFEGRRQERPLPCHGCVVGDRAICLVISRTMFGRAAAKGICLRKPTFQTGELGKIGAGRRRQSQPEAALLARARRHARVE